MPLESIMLELIKAARTSFSQVSSDSNKLKIFKQNIGGESYHVFGIEKDAQSKEVIKSARAIVLREMNLPADTSIIQVIGDSSNFQDNKVNIAKTFLYEFLNKYSKALILYGLTGHNNMSTNQYDVNGLVNAWIDQNSRERCLRVLGNAVDYHTPLAIEKWGCTVGDIRNIFLVYTENKPGAKFGDDVMSSDYIVKKQHNSNQEDFCLCLEGGVQSFNQIVRMLNENVKVFALKGIRGEQNPACFDSQKRQFIPYFSAAEFLSIIYSSRMIFRFFSSHLGPVFKRSSIAKTRNSVGYSYVFAQSERLNLNPI